MTLALIVFYIKSLKLNVIFYFVSYVSITWSVINFLLGTKYMIVRNIPALGCGDDFVKIVHVLFISHAIETDMFAFVIVLAVL